MAKLTFVIGFALNVGLEAGCWWIYTFYVISVLIFKLIIFLLFGYRVNVPACLEHDTTIK